MIRDLKIRSNYQLSDFVDCQDRKSLTAAEKLKIVQDWEKFIIARMNTNQAEIDAMPGTDFGPRAIPTWTKRLYSAFSQHLGHIAHNNIHGFFSAQFAEWDCFVRNLKQARDQDVNHYNTWGAHHDQGDLNRAMGAVARCYLEEREEHLRAAQRVEHAKEDLEIDKAIFRIEGTITRGYLALRLTQGFIIEAAAMVKVTTLEMSREQAWEAFCAAVTEWAATPEGLEARKSPQEPFSLADVSLRKLEKSATFEAIANKHKVEHFSITRVDPEAKGLDDNLLTTIEVK